MTMVLMDTGDKVMRVGHPGKPDPQRIYCEVGRLGGAFALDIEPGADVLESVERWGMERGCASVAFRLLSGCAEILRVMTGGPDFSGARAATFHGPHAIDCPAGVLGGHGVLGSAVGRPALHAHAVFVDANGHARGCHLIRGNCIAGAGGIRAAAFEIEGSGFEVRLDAETRFDVFFPRANA